jgi:hypothetical protein
MKIRSWRLKKQPEINMQNCSAWKKTKEHAKNKEASTKNEKLM